MRLLRRPVEYDRDRILDAADRARVRKKRTRAIELYRWVLAMEPGNTELHARLAPLLAEAGQAFDAWCSFRTVARAHLRDDRPDKALAAYREATLYVPREPEAWLGVARLQYKTGDFRQAVETLLEGSRNFRTHWLRPQAIHLLRRAREVEEWSFEVVSELAQLLALCDQKREARLLLDGLAQRSGGERLRRVRTAQLRISPSPHSAWRWLSELLRSPGDRLHDAAVAPRLASAVVPLRAARRYGVTR